MKAANVTQMVDRIDDQITGLMARYGVVLLRISVGVVFVWFGALKLAPGMSPAEDLVRAATPFLPAAIFIPVLALWEIVIGLGFLTGRFMRATILLLMAQMGGTVLPLFTLPERVYHNFPGLTLEGQYIIKNVVLISAALVIGGTLRRRDSDAEHAG